MIPGDELRHVKFAPYELKDDAPDDGALDDAPPVALRPEHLEPLAPAITLMMSGDWSWTVLVCKDVLSADVARLLEDLRARLVLVPAMSGKTEIFEQRCRELAVNAQAVAVVANTPMDPAAAAALIARPLREAPLEVCKPPRLLAPGAVVASARELSIRLLDK
jgi:hypothetical protein